jgi:hypothetical protein
LLLPDRGGVRLNLIQTDTQIPQTSLRAARSRSPSAFALASRARSSLPM